MGKYEDTIWKLLNDLEKEKDILNYQKSIDNLPILRDFYLIKWVNDDILAFNDFSLSIEESFFDSCQELCLQLDKTAKIYNEKELKEWSNQTKETKKPIKLIFDCIRYYPSKLFADYYLYKILESLNYFSNNKLKLKINRKISVRLFEIIEQIYNKEKSMFLEFLVEKNKNSVLCMFKATINLSNYSVLFELLNCLNTEQFEK